MGLPGYARVFYNIAGLPLLEAHSTELWQLALLEFFQTLSMLPQGLWGGGGMVPQESPEGETESGACAQLPHLAHRLPSSPGLEQHQAPA